jgi:hypothetical protein
VNVLSLSAAGLLATGLALTARADQPVCHIVRVVTPVPVVSTPGSRPIVVIRPGKIAPVKTAKVQTKALIQTCAH